MKRRKMKSTEVLDVKVCRCCLSAESDSLKPGSGHDGIMEQLTGSKGDTASAWLCYRCHHTLSKITAFRDMCLRAETALREYYSKRAGKRKVDLDYFNSENVKHRLVDEPSFSNILCIAVATVPPDSSDTFVSSVEVVSRNRNARLPRNFAEDMIEDKDVKLESDIGTESFQEAGDFERGVDSNSNSDFNALEVLGAIKEEFEPCDDDFGDAMYVIDVKKRMKKDLRKKDKSKKKQPKECDSKKDCLLAKRKHERIVIEGYKASEVLLSPEEQAREREERASQEGYAASLYRCELCVLAFKHQHTLDSHMKKHCKSRGAYECPLCRQRFPSERPLRAHRHLHALRLVCHACGARLRDRARLREHLEWHAGTTHPCPVCGGLFSRRTTLKNHMRLKHGHGRFECDSCSKVFEAKERLKEHQLRHVAVRPHACDSCPKTFYTVANLSVHRATHRPSLEHYCVECDRHYKSAAILRNHLDKSSRHRDTSAFKFACSQCSRRYESPELLARHVHSLHERVPLLACEACGARYATRQGLNFHRRCAHQGYTLPRKYACRTCDKAFSSKALLTNHMRTHTGERPFECSSCHRKFTQKSAMRTHVKLVHLKIKRQVKSTKKTAVSPPKNDASGPDTAAPRVPDTVTSETVLYKVEPVIAGWAGGGAVDVKQNELEDSLKKSEVNHVFYME